MAGRLKDMSCRYSVSNRSPLKPVNIGLLCDLAVSRRHIAAASGLLPNCPANPHTMYRTSQVWGHYFRVARHLGGSVFETSSPIVHDGVICQTGCRNSASRSQTSLAL